MGYIQIGLIHYLVFQQQDVYVYDSRPEARPGLTAHVLLHLFDPFQKFVG